MAYQRGEILFNKYRLEELVGEGAFAQVWRAHHLELDAPRALKILMRNASGVGSTEFDDFFGRFRLEAQLGNQLIHPNIVRTYDFERDQDTLILVMDYAPRGSLASLLKKMAQDGASMPVEQAIRISLEVAQGLATMHAMDIIHRDLKPSNILFNNKGEAQIADLGLAQTPGGPSKRSQLSNPQPHPGTPGHMSPEQETTFGYLKPTSDIYALGLVLFEMLTGRNYQNLKPNTRVRSLRQDVPKWLDDLLAQMLDTDPNRRPWDGTEVARLLHEGLAGKSNKTAKGAAITRKWPIIAGIVGIGAVCLILISILILQGLQGITSSLAPSQTAPIVWATATTRPIFTSTDAPPTRAPTAVIPPTRTSTPYTPPTPTDRPTSTPSPQPTLTPTPLEPEAVIQYPQNGDDVVYKVTIEGVISGLKPNMRAFLCIQSQDYLLIFPQAEIFPDQTGQWSVTGYYQSVGYDYATYVVVTSNTASANLLADVYYRAYGIEELPADTEIISPIVIVTRK